ncbi:hypothetical protein [Desulfovibrio cuneatus]|uniref:hypothetical protein n=1 Tax=Desulfovibrio cuneatus TaxID=159728 RepID=UPI000485F245|nr:hypothetical protein [Desulfovibrio cuneatus]
MAAPRKTPAQNVLRKRLQLIRESKECLLLLHGAVCEPPRDYIPPAYRAPELPEGLREMVSSLIFNAFGRLATLEKSCGLDYVAQVKSDSSSANHKEL